MVVKSDGTKWACSSCLKGHRVSGCNHTDRELTLVPKKGRPVTQCHHCRLERKKRSAHVKCDCGETEKVHHPKEKCIHLREAEERAKSTSSEELLAEKDFAHLAAIAEEQGCCCHHGGKCTCSLLKKETMNGAPHGPAVHKPRLESTKSDGSITVFANGHHKPVHRKNNAAHENGMPYKMPLSRAHTDHSVMTAARRSVDSLTVNTAAMDFFHSAPSASTDRFISKSEQHSPTLHAKSAGGSDLADFGALGPVRTNLSIDSADSIAFPAFDPMSGVDGSYDVWSAYPSSDALNYPNNNPFGAWATTFDASSLAQPALTAASSGTQSDIDEIPPMDEMYHFGMPSIAEDTGFDASMNDGSNVNRHSLPPNFFGNIDFTAANMDEWQSPGDASGQSADAKSKGLVSSPGVNDSWTTPASGNMVQRYAATNAQTGRPQSHSIGPGSAPNEDIIRQLFPDIDIATAFGNGASPGDLASMAMKRFGGMPLNDPASTAMDYSADDNETFAAQSWNDGSISVPSDAFNSAFNLDQDFSASEFSDNWQHAQ